MGVCAQGVNGSLLFVIFIHWMCYGMIVVATPALALDLYDDNHSAASLFYGLLNGGSALLQFFSNPLYGSLSDSFGRKKFLLISIGGLFVSLGTVAIGMNKEALIVSAVTRGITDCSLTISYAYLADLTTEFEVTKSYGSLGAAVGLGLVIGSGIGAVTLRWAFLVACIISACNGLVCWRFVQEPLQKLLEQRRRGESGSVRKEEKDPNSSELVALDDKTSEAAKRRSSAGPMASLAKDLQIVVTPAKIDENGGAFARPLPSLVVTDSAASRVPHHRATGSESTSYASSAVSSAVSGGSGTASQSQTPTHATGSAPVFMFSAEHRLSAISSRASISESGGAQAHPAGPVLADSNAAVTVSSSPPSPTISSADAGLLQLTSAPTASSSAPPSPSFVLASSSSTTAASSPVDPLKTDIFTVSSSSAFASTESSRAPSPVVFESGSKEHPVSWKAHVRAHWSPFGTMVILRSNTYLAYAAWAFFLNVVSSTGVIAIWLVYTDDRFEWSNLQAGIFVFVVGVSAVIVQGVVLPYVVPDHRWGEKKTIYVTLPIHVVSLVLFGLCWLGYQMYIVCVVTMLGFVFAPTLRGTMVKHVPRDRFGTLQGALASLSSAGAIFGPLLLNGSYSYAVSDLAPVYLPGIAFYIGGLLNALALAVMVFAFKHYKPHQSQSSVSAFVRSSVSTMPDQASADAELELVR